MANEVERIQKMRRCLSVKFHAKDKDGDTVFVEIEGHAAQQLLEWVQRGLLDSELVKRISHD